MTENDLKNACIDWFRELGWEYSQGETISPGGFVHKGRVHKGRVLTLFIIARPLVLGSL